VTRLEPSKVIARLTMTLQGATEEDACCGKIAVST
jgi:hypothetical protein